MASPGEVLGFWFGEGEERGRYRRAWFIKDPAFDETIRLRFATLHERALRGELADWSDDPTSNLALVIVLDQFSRNLFRNSPGAFSGDAAALAAARAALTRGDDRHMLPVERLFLYLPFEHSESLEDQRRSCELMRPLAEFPDLDDVYGYAVRHREIIERFGRFPHRNAALGRASTAAEIEFLKTPGSSF